MPDKTLKILSGILSFNQPSPAKQRHTVSRQSLSQVFAWQAVESIAFFTDTLRMISIVGLLSVLFIMRNVIAIIYFDQILNKILNRTTVVTFAIQNFISLTSGMT